MVVFNPSIVAKPENKLKLYVVERRIMQHSVFAEPRNKVDELAVLTAYSGMNPKQFGMYCYLMRLSLIEPTL